MVSASSSPPKNQALELPRSTHVTGKNGAPIPITKASKQELVAGLEQHYPKVRRVSPRGPQDLSDSDDESSGDELDVRQDPETPAHATKRPPPSAHTLPEVPDSQSPSKRRRYKPFGHSNDSDSRPLAPAHTKSLPQPTSRQDSSLNSHTRLASSSSRKSSRENGHEGRSYTRLRLLVVAAWQRKANLQMQVTSSSWTPEYFHHTIAEPRM